MWYGSWFFPKGNQDGSELAVELGCNFTVASPVD